MFGILVLDELGYGNAFRGFSIFYVFSYHWCNCFIISTVFLIVTLTILSLRAGASDPLQTEPKRWTSRDQSSRLAEADLELVEVGGVYIQYIIQRPCRSR